MYIGIYNYTGTCFKFSAISIKCYWFDNFSPDLSEQNYNNLRSS